MDNALSEKLNEFSRMVMDDAKSLRDDILVEIEDEKQERLNEKETEFLEEAYKEIQASIEATRRADREKVLQAETEAKRDLLLARERIILEVFTEVTDKLKAYRRTPEYKKWLVQKTKQALKEAGDGGRVIKVTGDDIVDISAEFDGGDIKVEAESDKDFLGGVTVTNTERHIAVDYSFKTMIAEQKKDFLNHSGLSVG